MKTQAKNLLSFNDSENALNHSIKRGIFGNIWDVIVFTLSSLSVLMVWAFHTTFQATKSSDEDE